jgi:hypothetical protein
VRYPRELPQRVARTLPAEPEFPFVLAAPAAPDAAIDALFRRSFGSAAPREPLHFVARAADGTVAAYVHYIGFKPGVYLCGGLCVAPRAYRALSPGARRQVAQAGSLSRWLLARSIAALEAKRAVFAFTGDARSRRDVLALGFEPAAGPYLVVQWHAAPREDRAGLVAVVATLGPF